MLGKNRNGKGTIIHLEVAVAVNHVENKNLQWSEVSAMKNDNIKIEKMPTEILEKCGIQYWLYDIPNHCAIPGANVMGDLADLELWDSFPQCLIDMELIDKASAEPWLEIHQRIAQGEAEISQEILVIENGVEIWKNIQYHTDFDENGKPISAVGIAENIRAFKRLSENYAKASKQCGVTMWMLDLIHKTIYDLNNATHMKIFDTYTTIYNVPEVFAEQDSPLHHEDVAAFNEMFKKLYAGEKTVSSVGRWWNDDHSSWLWYEISYTSIFDEKGKPFQAIGTAIDISERIRLEARYQEEIKWRRIHNQDVLGSFKLNLTQNICDDGQSEIDVILTFQGDGTVDDFFAHEYLAHVDEKDLKEYKKIFNRTNLLDLYGTGKTSIVRESYMSFWENKVHWIKVELDMFQNPKTGDIEAYIYATDIDQKKTAQSLVDTVVNMNYDFLALLDTTTEDYTLFSKTQGKTALPPFNTSNYKDEVAQYNHEFLIEEDIQRNMEEMTYENLFAQLEKQDVYTIYCGIKEKDGTISRKKMQFTYIDELREKIILARSDITDIYNQEKEKNQALKDALLAAQQSSTAKSEFLSRMSHEIRTPMNTIIGMSALAVGCVNDPEQVSDYLSKVGIAARFLLSLINDVLDMSRIESGKVFIRHEEIPFEEFINGVNGICHAQALEKGVEYDAILNSYLEDTYIGDAMKLQQVLVNILSNAIKFTPTGGKVQMIINQEKINDAEAMLRFTVNDTGVGINEEFLPQLFEPFEQQCSGSTTPYSGTGLGLAICKNLIDLMGGKISVNSIEGVGSEFTVEVKLKIAEKNKETTKIKPHLHLENLRALIVDDDILICQHTKEILLDMGLEVEYVISGAKAVEAVGKKWAKKEFYDIILVDWKMPDMDGIETTREIRKIVGFDVTIIIMTAYDWIVIEADAKNAGVNLLLSKPVFKSSLCSAFEKIYKHKEESSKQDSSEDFDFTGKRVLLAEDHLLNIEVAKKLLGAKHLEVEVAENGLRAIEIFAQKDAGYYNAILMDIRMPVMDGIAATKAIRQMRKSDAQTIPIIAMTANAFDEDIEKTKSAGMNAHLAKPIEPKLLYQTIQHFLNRDEK
ncbi:MAG: response regulator [Clostridiales bacterium]